jgi:cobalt-precorrin 5A hydrolase
MVVLVTGSSKGIGYQIASDLLDQGHDLVLHCNRNKSSLEGLLSAYKSNSVIIQADLSSYNDIKKLVDETTNKLSFPDCVINNAGIAESADISLDIEEWDKMFDKTISVNLKAPGLIFKEFIKYKRLDDILPKVWESYDAIIMILAVGAVVRKIAPYLKSKESDPAVIVLNLELNRVLPLLSGHLGGANELASLLERKLPNCINFITTATDQTNTLSFEMLAKKRGWRVKNLKALANISNRLLNNKSVKVATYKAIFESIENRENLKLINFDEVDKNSVVIGYQNIELLTLVPKLYLGIGCNKGTKKELIKEAVELFLDEFNIEKTDIAKLASFEAKSKEKGLLEFAKDEGFKIEFFSKDDINSVEKEFSASASTKFFGLKGVAEPSSVLASEYKELIFKKRAYFGAITIAGAI